jgi:hypothetical protein
MYVARARAGEPILGAEHVTSRRQWSDRGVSNNIQYFPLAVSMRDL